MSSHLQRTSRHGAKLLCLAVLIGSTNFTTGCILMDILSAIASSAGGGGGGYGGGGYGGGFAGATGGGFYPPTTIPSMPTPGRVVTANPRPTTVSPTVVAQGVGSSFSPTGSMIGGALLPGIGNVIGGFGGAAVSAVSKVPGVSAVTNAVGQVFSPVTRAGTSVINSLTGWIPASTPPAAGGTDGLGGATADTRGTTIVHPTPPAGIAPGSTTPQ